MPPFMQVCPLSLALGQANGTLPTLTAAGTARSSQLMPRLTKQSPRRISSPTTRQPNLKRVHAARFRFRYRRVGALSRAASHTGNASCYRRPSKTAMQDCAAPVDPFSRPSKNGDRRLSLASSWSQLVGISSGSRPITRRHKPVIGVEPQKRRHILVSTLSLTHNSALKRKTKSHEV